MWRKIKKNVNKTRGGLSERPAHSPALVEAGFGTERFSLCHGEAPDTSSRHGGSGLSLPGCETPAGSLFANVEVKVNTGKADQMPILPDCSSCRSRIRDRLLPSRRRRPTPDVPLQSLPHLPC